MTNNCVLRTVRITVLSTLMALAAFSFLAFGSASAHARSFAHSASNSTTISVHIIDNSRGLAVFSPNAITVKSGTQVTIVNSTKVRQIVFGIDPIVFFVLAPGAAGTIVPQVSPELLKLYGEPQASLLITISTGP